MSLSPPSKNYSWGKYSSSSSSIHLSEKHISVDPISLRQEKSLPPPSGDDEDHDHEEVIKHPKINKLMMFNCSIPKSPIKQKKKKVTSNTKMNEMGLSRQQSVALSNLERLRESHLHRSKSCGERRTCQPSLDDFDFLCPTTPTTPMTTTTTTTTKIEHHEDANGTPQKKRGDDARPSVVSYSGEEKFKCCLFLPAFGKPPKPVRPRKDDEEFELMSELNINKIGMVSHRASLEKFECGSWRSSSAVINSEDDQDGDTTSNLFFDLPVELIRCSNVNDTESPVNAAFLFDDNNHKVNLDHHHHPNGVLKNATTTTTTTQPRKSHESSTSSTRHVRFSTSSSPNTSPTSSCVTPRLLETTSTPF